MLLSRGVLVVTVRDSSGRPLKGLRCRAIADLGDAWDSWGVLPRTDARGRCTFDSIPATGYWIEIDRLIAGGGYSVLAIGRALVLPSKTASVTLVTK